MIRKFFQMAPEGAGTTAAAPATGTPPAAPATGTTPAAPAAPAAAPPAAAPVTTPTPEAKPPETTLLTTPAAEELSVKFPDGFTADKTMLDKFLPIAKEAKLDSATAQKFVDLHVATMQAVEAQHVEQVTKWAEETKTAFGAEFNQTIDLAKRTLDRIGTPGVKEMLAKSGLGNNKDVIKMFADIGKLITEDRLPGTKPTAASAEPSREEMLREAFPNSPQMFGG